MVILFDLIIMVKSDRSCGQKGSIYSKIVMFEEDINIGVISLNGLYSQENVLAFYQLVAFYNTSLKYDAVDWVL